MLRQHRMICHVAAFRFEEQTLLIGPAQGNAAGQCKLGLFEGGIDLDEVKVVVHDIDLRISSQALRLDNDALGIIGR